MMTGIFAAFVAVLCVCHAGGQTTDCMEAAAAAIKFRDYGKTLMGSESAVNDFFKTAVIYFNINLYNDQEIEELVCSITDAREKTIAYIARHTNVIRDAIQLESAYTSLMNLLHASEISDRYEYLEKEITFYDATGFPNFPLEISEAQLSKVIDKVDNSTLASLFWQFADVFSLQVGFHREEFFTALTDSDSLEDYVKAAFMQRLYAGDVDYQFEDEVQASSDAQMIREQVSAARADYSRVKERAIQAEQFLAVLEKTGILGVTRGGPELYSCDFIADTAVEALGYAVEVFGRIMVQSTMKNDMGLDFTADDTSAVRAWVCSLASSKTRKDSMKFVPEVVMQEMDINRMYQGMAFSVQQALINPQFLIGRGMSDIRMVKIAESLDFPNVPKDQAKQLADMIKAEEDNDNLDVDVLAQILQDADSLKQADYASGRTYLHGLVRKVEKFGGKTDIALKLASLVYQLAMSADELGLLMLPPS